MTDRPTEEPAVMLLSAVRRSSRRASIRFAAVWALAAVLCWPAPRAAAQTGDAPPLIDRELFFGDPEISAAQLSPDGEFLAFIKPLDRTRNIWVKRLNEPFENARPVTADTRRPIPGYFWSRDGRFILFAQDQGGNENYNVYAVNPAEAPATGQQVPAARNLTDAKDVRAVIYAVPRSDADALYVGVNERDKAWHDLYKVKISTGERTLVRTNTDRLVGWVFDRTDRLRLAQRVADSGDNEILRVDDQGFTKIYGCSVFETCVAIRFHEDGKRAYLITNKGADVNLTRLVLLDVTTGAEELVESDPQNKVDLGSAVFSERTNALLATVYDDERKRILWRDPAFEQDYRLLQQRVPGADLTFTSGTDNEVLWLVSASSDVEPGTTYLFDRRSKTLTRQYVVRERLPREALAPMKAISYESSDGLEIPAFLTLPRGAAPRSLPMVLVPHGGPWARDSWGYNSLAQFLANRGYAVLQPNFRGSTGYGKKLLDAGNRQWGDKMQDDLTWGVKHLIAEGIADPRRVGIMGGSYGGYATLAGLAFTPDVYAAGVSIVGPSNLITLLESIPPYWEAGRKLFHERMGDPGTPDGRKQLERQSPLNSADRIAAPLLVIQGANDPRVKKAESDQIVVALRDRGFAVEYLVAPDEGHGFARPVNNMAMFASAEKFLARHLAGRYQEGMTPEVAARLPEITVDPKTVEKPKPVDMTAVGTPTPAMDLVAGAASYAARIELGGQTMEVAIRRTIEDENGTWLVTESVRMPMGEAIDRVTLSKGTLLLRTRSVTQGPATMGFAVAGGKATGEAKMGEQAKAIAVDLDGDLFADGAGSHAVMATLPLADGYTVRFRNLDLQSQKVIVKQLAVVGSESVTVPAGTFDAYRVEITSLDDGAKTTLWVSKSDRKVVRVLAVLPRLNGATLTSELQP
jgi:dipeptidyl aminopeptidase/acylaminoacyl peptidase